MPTYQYKAKKGSSEIIKGQIEARTQDEAVELINQSGLLPVSIEENSYAKLRLGGRHARKVRLREIYIFSRQLANLIKSGIPILRALSLIGDQIGNPYLKDVIKTIENDVRDGKGFSDCLEGHPEIFSGLYVAMIRAGEEGGNLKEMLMRMSRYLQTQDEIASKIRTALAYPILMAAVGLGTVIFILTFVLPRIIPLFSNIGKDLPLATRVLINTSNFLRGEWHWILLGFLFVFFVVTKWAKSKESRILVDRLQMNIPLFGDLILKSELARFCRTLGLLLKSGVSLTRGLRIAIPILDNRLLRDELKVSQEDLESGTSLSKSLQKIRLMPAIVCNLIAVGEESGNLEEALEDIADSFEQDSNEKIKTMTTLLEPIMILIVGLIVGFMVMAMLLPIFQMDILAR